MDEADLLQVHARELSALPDPTYWFEKLGDIRKELGKSNGDIVAMLAKRMWLIKVCDSSYPLHPSVKHDFIMKKYFLNDRDNLLIWATLIALIDGDDADERYQKCKLNIERKYGSEAWYRVYLASKKIRKVLINPSCNIPEVLKIMATKSITVQGWIQEDYLSQLPKRV